MSDLIQNGAGTANPGAPGTPDPANEPAENVLGTAWHAKAFLGLVVLVAGLLFGVYQPWMRSMAEKSMRDGDIYRDHALRLRADTGHVSPDLEALDEKINGIYQIVAAYMQFGRAGGGSFDPADPLNRRIVQSIVRLENDIRTVDDEVARLGQEYGLTETFAFLFDHLKVRGANVEQRLSATVGQPLTQQTYTQQYYDGLCYTALPDYLETIKKIRDLFLVEPTFDRAMAEYVDAIGFSRSWTEPRFRMADLYRDREWPEFAMMGYLRIVKLDPSGSEGQRALAELRKFQGVHPEADFHCGVAELLLGRDEDALRTLRRFLGTNPTNVQAPKVAELIGQIESGNRTFVKQYLRDEIWL